MHITGIYAAIGALLFIFLTFRVIRLRFSSRTGIGDGGDEHLIRQIRVHGNAAETLPLGLILLFLVEWNQTQPLLVHAFGIALILGRALHAFGLSGSSGTSPGRLVGMLLTLLSLTAMAILLLWQSIVASIV